MQLVLFLRKKMKKKSQEEIKKLFEQYGCELLDQYSGSGVPMSYICSCGKTKSISLDKFRNKIKKLSNYQLCSKTNWTEEKDNVLRSLYGKETREEILRNIPDANYESIKHRAKVLGLRGDRKVTLVKSRKNQKNKYTYDVDFFKNKNNKSSFWAGFLTGCSRFDLKNNSIHISLPIKQKAILDLFQDLICHTGTYTVNKSKIKISLFGAKKWIIDLYEKFNLNTEKPIERLAPLDLTEMEALNFLAGYIEALGEIKYSKKDNRFELNFFGSEEMMVWTKVYFDELCPSVKRRYAEITKIKNGYFKYSLGNYKSRYILKKMLSLNFVKSSKWQEAKIVLAG
jgi:hypothetical protein